MSDDIEVTPELTIPGSELHTRASRSGGPGGQHVNTSSTRIELVWNVLESTVLDEAQREKISARLSTRISGEGNLMVASSSSRSQHQNREEARARMAGLIRGALQEQKARKKTRPSRASKEKRLQTKRRRSETKRLRRSAPED